MNLNKSLEFFNPIEHTEPIHIIGCGAIGSTIAENLTRLGIKALHLWDFDTVEEHNIANQIFYPTQVGKTKIDALSEILLNINPEIKLILHPEGWTPESNALYGYVFLCVDSIETRKAIINKEKPNLMINAIFDCRMRLTDAQHYAADWHNPISKENLLNTMDFTDAEAEEATPKSACGTTLSLVYTVRTIAAIAVNNCINKMLNNTLYKTVLLDMQHLEIESFKE